MGLEDNDDDTFANMRDQMKTYYNDTMKQFEKKPCEQSRIDLKECLMESDCHRIHKRSLKDCLRSTDGTVPNQCLSIRISFFECKRSILDNRQRFRGRKGY